MTDINLNKIELYTASEASKILGKEPSYIRQIYTKYPNRFPDGSIRKMGRDYILTKVAIDALKKDHSKV